MCGETLFTHYGSHSALFFDGKEVWRITMKSVHPTHRKLWLLLRRPIKNNIVLRQERDFSANKCHFLGLLTFNFPSLLLKRLWGPVGQRRKARHGETSNWLSSLCCSIICYQHSRCWMNSDETFNFAKFVLWLQNIPYIFKGQVDLSFPASQYWEDAASKGSHLWSTSGFLIAFDVKTKAAGDPFILTCYFDLMR